MASIEQIMLGLEAAVGAVNGLRVSEYIPGQIVVPAAIIGVPPIDYERDLGQSGINLDFTVTVLVSAGLDRVGQLKLAGYANKTGATSVVAAIRADRDLGGAAHDCKVTGFRPLGIQEVGVIQYFGGVFTVRVMAA
jgi:hypothetical protein